MPKKYTVLPDQLQCSFCAGWFSKYGLRNHERVVHEKTMSVSHPGGRKNPWNKGQNRQTDARITGHSQTTRDLCRAKALGRVHTAATKAKIRHHAVANALGGHTSKRRLDYVTKEGKIINLHSSYEVQAAMNLDAANIAWTRSAPLPWQDDKGDFHRYYADFYLPAFDVYLDPKNAFLQRQDAAKLRAVATQCGVKVFVLGLDELDWASIFVKISPP